MDRALLEEKRGCGDAAAVCHPYGSFNRKVPKGCPIYGWRADVRVRISRLSTHRFWNHSVRNHPVGGAPYIRIAHSRNPCTRILSLGAKSPMKVPRTHADYNIFWFEFLWWKPACYGNVPNGGTPLGGTPWTSITLEDCRGKWSFEVEHDVQKNTPSTPTTPHTTTPNP